MKSLANNLVKIWFLFLTALWLGGCSVGALPSYDVPPHGPIPQGRSIVFGGILLKSQISGLFSDGSMNIINTENGKQVFRHQIKGSGGPFYWSLPVGQYAILDLLLTINLVGSRGSSIRIYAQFQVDSEQKLIYIGTLGFTRGSPFIIDDFDSATAIFHAQYPTFNAVPIKQLLQLEKRR